MNFTVPVDDSDFPTDSSGQVNRYQQTASSEEAANTPDQLEL